MDIPLCNEEVRPSRNRVTLLRVAQDLKGTVGLLSSCIKQREPFYFSIWLGQGVIWLGILVFYFFVGRVGFPIRDSCLSLSLIGNHT
jgi:hypothetical protein